MKRILLFVVFILSMSTFSFSQDVKYYLSSHILDIEKGSPAANVEIVLSKKGSDGTWNTVDSRYTDNNGRVKDFLKETEDFDPIGVYKLTYFTAPYFEKQGKKSFYPYVEVVFEIYDKSHYHVPITLSAYGYSTYRGS